MIVEAITFSINLSFFSSLIWSLVSFQDIRLFEKIKKFPFFVLFSTLFYASFYLSSFSHTKFFEFKLIYFSWYSILVLLLLLGLFLFISKRSYLVHTPFLSMAISPYLFFLLFGFENFQLWNGDFPSYSLLKTQNPLIGSVCFVLLLIKPNKLQIASFLLSVSILFYYLYPLKQFPYSEINILHYRYIPQEFFLEESVYLFEENSGIYTEKKADADDKLYKLTWKPLKQIGLPVKQTIQTLASNFEFPLILSEDNKIILMELSRSYNGNVFKVIFDFTQESQDVEIIGNTSVIQNGKISIEGPIF